MIFPLPQAILAISSDGQELAEIIDFGVPETWKIAKWMVLEPPQHRQTQKLCGKRCISIPFWATKKIHFFQKSFFSHEFWHFSSHQSKDFRVLADPAMCPYLKDALELNDEQTGTLIACALCTRQTVFHQLHGVSCSASRTGAPEGERKSSRYYPGSDS